ncbi:alpha/beta hydrolase [Paenibacillus wynnii]|uniref:alpha/beta hydrolase n=1 Tax=Paenibacillus wynnii TaxID=268407 RepID=UPI00068AFF8B|nr:alpha/beta hydrolase-fold protein [Paenibacillus wynnii]
MLHIVSYIGLILLSGCTGKTDTPESTVLSADESSQVVTVSMHRIVLDREMKMSIYLPPAYSSDVAYPVLYLLYGYGGKHDTWFEYLHINGVADRLIEQGKMAPVIIVSPDYGNSFGVNSQVGEGRDPGSVDIGPYEDYLTQEVIPYVDSQYSTVMGKEGRYVGGASMGGYAALYLGFNYPELFSKVGAHSAALWDYTSTDQFIGQRDWLYANEALREIRDPFKLAESQRLDEMQVYLDSGTEDALTEKDYLLYMLLRMKGIDAQWVSHLGGHNSSYWSSQLENYLIFYNGSI